MAAKRKRRLRVALAVPQGLPFLERVMHGIIDYARTAGGWTFTRLPEAFGASIRWLRQWPGDGAFAMIVTPADVRIAKRLPFPVVNLASHIEKSGLPAVVVDHARVGEIAAQHLLERRFQSFGYYGAAGLWFSQLRGESFRKTVIQGGGQCQMLEADSGMSMRGWRDQQRQLEAWLPSLRPPVGIMASNDLRAGMVLEACLRVGLRVPEDVAVIGVDNDPVFAEFDDPPLTSVSRNDREVGRQAAALLAKLMAGGKPPPGPIFIPPDGIVQRRSTETVAIGDPVIANIVQYIHDHVHSRFGVEQLLKEAPLSRRSLEYRFRTSLGSSPYDYINKVRVDAARQLLADPRKMKLAAVSSACGFSNPRRFRLVFRRLSGMTPAEYRRSVATASSSRK